MNSRFFSRTMAVVVVISLLATVLPDMAQAERAKIMRDGLPVAVLTGTLLLGAVCGLGLPILVASGALTLASIPVSNFIDKRLNIKKTSAVKTGTALGIVGGIALAVAATTLCPPLAIVPFVTIVTGAALGSLAGGLLGAAADGQLDAPARLRDVQEEPVSGVEPAKAGPAEVSSIKEQYEAAHRRYIQLLQSGKSADSYEVKAAYENYKSLYGRYQQETGLAR